MSWYDGIYDNWDDVGKQLTKEFAKKHQLQLDEKGGIVSHVCYDLERAVIKVGTSQNHRISAIYIREFSGFSNALMQISNALWIAQVIGAKTIYISPKLREGNFLVNKVGNFQFPYYRAKCKEVDITFIREDPPPSLTILEGTFQGIDEIFTGIFQNAPPFKQRLNWFKHCLGFNYENNLVNDEDIVIHIRSGDIFDPERPELIEGYYQPPLSYYKKVINHISPKKVHLVYEDDLNPVINPLKEWLSKNNIPFFIHSSTLKNDINVLLSAKTLVVGQGTFMEGVTALSNYVQHVFSFNESFWCRITNIKHTIIVDTDNRYEKIIDLSNMHELMLNYPIEPLEIINKNT